MILITKKRSLVKKKGISVFYGVHPGAGLRHLSLSAAVYLARIRRRRTAYIEIAEDTRLTGVIGRESVVVGGSVGYEVYGCNLFPAVSAMDALRIINDEYEEFVLTISNADCVLPLPSDARRFILGSVKPWHFQEYRDFIHNLSDHEYALGRCLSFGLTPEERRLFIREFHKDISEMACIRDPFDPDHSEVSFLKGLYGG